MARPAAAALAATAWTIVVLPALAQSTPAESGRTVQQGVFTMAQAARGESLYAANCARCHEGADVDGPSLVGDEFIDRWREDTLDNLFNFIRTRMPGDAPGTLQPAAYVDLVAYLLDANEIPSGASELVREGLADTLLVGTSGPQPLPASALVQIVGCLTQDSARNWTLTHSGRPARTRNANQISDEDVAAGTARAPGVQTVALQNLAGVSAFAADANQQHKVLVKGALTRTADGQRLRVLAARSIADTCGP